MVIATSTDIVVVVPTVTVDGLAVQVIVKFVPADAGRLGSMVSIRVIASSVEMNFFIV